MTTNSIKNREGEEAVRLTLRTRLKGSILPQQKQFKKKEILSDICEAKVKEMYFYTGRQPLRTVGGLDSHDF
jgi:hypothetical protein